MESCGLESLLGQGSMAVSCEHSNKHYNPIRNGISLTT